LRSPANEPSATLLSSPGCRGKAHAIAIAITGPPTPTSTNPALCSAGVLDSRLNVSLMSPVAAHPGTTVPAHLNRDVPAKGSSSADHDASDQNHASSTGSRPVPKHSVETTSAVAPPSPSRFTHSDQRRTRTAPNIVPSYDPSAAVQAGRELQHAVEPVLSERDSIFATHYTGGDAPVTALKERKVKREEEEEEKSQDDQSSMAIPMPPQAFMRLQSAFNKDRPVSPLSPYSLQDGSPGITRRPVSRTGLPPQYQRRSLYDIHDMDTTLIDSEVREEDISTPRMSRSPAPDTSDTPTIQGKVAFANDVEGSAERQQYRSWRAGKAKLEGLTIAQSQRRQSKAELGEDQEIIDAQLPTPEAPAINVRSRKASHYLGLFKENEGSARQQHVTHKLQDLLNQSKQPDENKPDQDSSGSQDDKQYKDEEETQRMPMDLLDEIRNHHHLAPGKARKISYPKALPGHDGERLGHQDRNRKATEEEDSDREHISSATYFPHQGVALGDSPTDESQQAARNARAQAVLAKEKQQQAADDTMPMAGSEDAEVQNNGELSLCREPSNHSVESNAKSMQSADYLATDSEYESGYSTSGSLSQASEDEDTTPTATPTAKSTMVHAKRKHSHAQPLEAMPAVELKPFSHQVGGHTRMYRFSRRAVCKQLNSKENMFYETIEKYHPELLGFMPR
jgi:inositol-hexakisphosphate kinase